MPSYNAVFYIEDRYARRAQIGTKIEATDPTELGTFAASFAAALQAIVAGEVLHYDLEMPDATVQGTAAAGSNVDEELILNTITDDGTKVKLSLPCPDKTILVGDGSLDTGATGVETALESLIDNVLVSDGESINVIRGGTLARR